MAKRTGLGRGIGALIPTTGEGGHATDVFFESSADTEPKTEATKGASASGASRSRSTATTTPRGNSELLAVPGARLASLHPNDIVPNAQQPRTEFDEEQLAELVASIREVGVLQPIVVRPLEGAAAEKRGGHYELIMGERRLRASKVAGLKAIPAVVKETPDEDMLRDALLENLHRAQLNPLEEASAYQQLLADFGITQEELATRIGRSRPQISNTLRLLKLPESVQSKVAAGVLSAGHARAILSADKPEDMIQLADRIINEDLSVRSAEAAAAKTARASRKPSTSIKAGRHTAHLNELATHLGDRLDTRVHIALTARRGQITIDFATVHDLNRILSELGEPTFAA